MSVARDLLDRLAEIGATVRPAPDLDDGVRLISRQTSESPAVSCGSAEPAARNLVLDRTTAAGALAFAPVAPDGRSASKPVLERELLDGGWQPGLTLLPDQKCWLETGHFDADGHSMGVRLADQIGRGLDDLRDQILHLAHAGRRVRIATDHGWLLLPGGLPVAKLETGLTETKWSRCAIVKEGAPASVPQLPWSWNWSVMVASAPGVHAFRAGQDYAHGGISPQESVVPELIVAPIAAVRRVIILEVEWAGLRMRIRAENGDGLTADLRLGAEGDGGSVADRPACSTPMGAPA
jgi:hypothetical protein